jgi:hypothetical protein
MCARMLRDVRYAANDLRRVLGEPIPDRRPAAEASWYVALNFRGGRLTLRSCLTYAGVVAQSKGRR